MHAHPEDEVVRAQIHEIRILRASCGTDCEPEAIEGLRIGVVGARTLDDGAGDADVGSSLEGDSYLIL